MAHPGSWPNVANEPRASRPNTRRLHSQRSAALLPPGDRQREKPLGVMTQRFGIPVQPGEQTPCCHVPSIERFDSLVDSGRIEPERTVSLAPIGQAKAAEAVTRYIITHAPRSDRRQIPLVAQRDTPWGGPETPSIFQISPVRVTTYAVFPMNSSEVGRSRPSVMTVKVPSPLTLTSAPVFGSAGEPSGSPAESRPARGRKACDRGQIPRRRGGWRRRPPPWRWATSARTPPPCRPRAGGGRGRPRPCTPCCPTPPARSGRCCRTRSTR